MSIENNNLKMRSTLPSIYSPLVLLALVIIVIFVVELGIMFFVIGSFPLSNFLEAVIDSTILVVVLFPVLYLLIFKPLIALVSRLKDREVELAKLYKAQLNIAETLQEALLKSPQQLEGLDFGYLYHPASEEARVGGDFYDVFEVEHKKIGIIIGDVSGKGLSAATLTSLVKNTVKAYAYQQESPATIIAKTNEIIRKSSKPSLFVTIFFGLYDLETRSFIYCNAGHPQPIVKSKTQETRVLKTSSPAIGIVKSDFINEEEVFKKGDFLVLYTDGVTEARCENDFFGEQRLLKLVKETDLPASLFPKTVFEEVQKFTKNNLSDDIVLLAVSLVN